MHIDFINEYGALVATGTLDFEEWLALAVTVVDGIDALERARS